jgi:polyisoprenoid-binding protein YceI
MTTPQIPAGTWTIDPSHSEVGFSVRHLMVAKVRGTFESFSGSVTIAEDPLGSKVEATIDLASINTRDPQRDGHLRSPDFFETDRFPTMTFTSTSVTPDGNDYRVVGDLTLKGTTRPVELALEFNGIHPDPWGGTRAGFSAEAEISRKEFGVDFEVPMDGPGVVVGDKIKVLLEIETVLQSADDAAEQSVHA